MCRRETGEGTLSTGNHAGRAERCASGACRKHIEVVHVPAEMGMGMVRNKAGNID